MLLKIVVVGKLKDRSLQSRCDEFARWLSPHAKMQIVELPDSTVEKEGEAILRTIDKDRGFVVALSEEGRQFTSREFAARLGGIDRKVIFVIGGPCGLAPAVRRRADLLWSLSLLTFTHEIARLLLFEQLFRAVNILNGGHYHND